MGRGRIRYKHKKDDVVLSFMVDAKIKKRLEKIAGSFDEGVADVFMGDVAETILIAFFKGNAPPADMEKARELVILKRKGRL